MLSSLRILKLCTFHYFISLMPHCGTARTASPRQPITHKFRKWIALLHQTRNCLDHPPSIGISSRENKYGGFIVNWTAIFLPFRQDQDKIRSFMESRSPRRDAISVKQKLEALASSRYKSKLFFSSASPWYKKKHETS